MTWSQFGSQKGKKGDKDAISSAGMLHSQLSLRRIPTNPSSYPYLRFPFASTVCVCVCVCANVGRLDCIRSRCQSQGVPLNLNPGWSCAMHSGRTHLALLTDDRPNAINNATPKYICICQSASQPCSPDRLCHSSNRDHPDLFPRCLRHALAPPGAVHRV